MRWGCAADVPWGCCSPYPCAVAAELLDGVPTGRARTTKRASERRAHVVDIPRETVRDARREADSAENIGECPKRAGLNLQERYGVPRAARTNHNVLIPSIYYAT